MMKKTISYLLGAAAALSLTTSCVLDQESPSAFDESGVFSNYELAEGNIFGICHTFGETNNYRGRFLPWYGFNTDIEWYNSFSSKNPLDGKNEIASYGITTNNSQLDLDNGPFNMMYSGIERANLTIKGLREYGNIGENRRMAHLLGEALTLRAMLYYDLIKAWGDVPARFSPVSSDDMYVKKSSRDVIFKQILADLEEAIGYLYQPLESDITAKTDRVNKLFAEGLYARIALMASGYALRPDDGNVGTGDSGSIRLSSDQELSKEVLYPKALTYLRDAITSGKASLLDYETLWRNFNSFDLAAGREVLYCIPFSAGRGRWNYTFAIKNEGANINGYSFSQGGVAGPVPTMWFKYDPKDVRRDITCVNYSWEKTGDITPAGIARWYFGKYRFEWMDSNPYTGGNDDGIKPIVMRYSDILLMAAEMENYLKGPDADAKEWLLEVRSRAFKGNEDVAETYVNSLSSKDDFFEAIVQERALEFCGEFLRKADLIRWNRLGSSLEAEKENLYDLRDKTGDFSYLSGNIWYRLGDDEESIQIWGLGKDEQMTPEGDDWEQVANYVKYDDSKESDLYDKKIDNIYINNPDQYMFWPIFNSSISNSQGHLVNDYVYAAQ